MICALTFDSPEGLGALAFDPVKRLGVPSFNPPKGLVALRGGRGDSPGAGCGSIPTLEELRAFANRPAPPDLFLLVDEPLESS
eukprot:3029454-Rhodomonas_salina.2